MYDSLRNHIPAAVFILVLTNNPEMISMLGLRQHESQIYLSDGWDGFIDAACLDQHHTILFTLGQDGEMFALAFDKKESIIAGIADGDEWDEDIPV